MAVAAAALAVVALVLVLVEVVVVVVESHTAAPAVELVGASVAAAFEATSPVVESSFEMELVVVVVAACEEASTARPGCGVLEPNLQKKPHAINNHTKQ